MMTNRTDLRAGIYIGSVAALGAIIVGASLKEMAQAEYGARILLWAAISLMTILAGSLAVQLPVRDCKVSSFLAIWSDSTPWAGTAYALAAAAVTVVFLTAREVGTISFIAVPPVPAILSFTYRTWLNRPVGRKGGIAL